MMSWLTLVARSNESVKWIYMGRRRRTYGHPQWWRASKALGLHSANAPLNSGPFTSIFECFFMAWWNEKKKKEEDQPLIPWYKYIFCNYVYPHVYNEKCKRRASVETARNSVNRCYKRGLQRGCLGVNTGRPLSNKRCVRVSTRTCPRSCVLAEY